MVYTILNIVIFYFTEEQVNGMISTENNFDTFCQLLEFMEHNFSAIGVSETWINALNSNSVNIPGYTFVSINRISKSGGGVGLYVRDDLKS